MGTNKDYMLYKHSQIISEDKVSIKDFESEEISIGQKRKF